MYMKCARSVNKTYLHAALDQFLAAPAGWSDGANLPCWRMNVWFGRWLSDTLHGASALKMAICSTYGHQYQLEVYDTDTWQSSSSLPTASSIKTAVSLKPNQGRKCIGSRCFPPSLPAFSLWFSTFNSW